MSKLERGEFSYAYDDVVGLHCVQWDDSSVVTTLSNCISPYPLDRVERLSRNEKKWIPVARLNLIKVYNSAMCGVELLDSAVGTYRTKIKGKKWWWSHFANTLGILIGAACKIYCVINPDADQSLLAFIRSVVQSYLHIDEIVPGPSFWKMKVVLHDSNQLTGHSHWPTTRETAKMCPPWLLKSSSHLL